MYTFVISMVLTIHCALSRTIHSCSLCKGQKSILLYSCVGLRGIPSNDHCYISAEIRIEIFLMLPSRAVEFVEEMRDVEEGRFDSN